MVRRSNKPPSMSTDKRFSALDGLRSILCVWVVAFHVVWFQTFLVPNGKAYSHYVSFLRDHSLFWRFVSHGALALEGFFLLSGIGIGRYWLARSRANHAAFFAFRELRTFFVKRFARIYPLYVLLLGVWIVALPKDREYVWMNLLMVHNTGRPIYNLPMGYTWNLAVQWHFYLVSPVLVAIFAALTNRGRRTFVVLTVCTFATAIAMGVRWRMASEARLDLPDVSHFGPIHPDGSGNQVVDFHDDGTFTIVSEPADKVRRGDPIYVRTTSRWLPFVLGVAVVLLLSAARDARQRRPRWLAGTLGWTVSLALVFGCLLFEPYFPLGANNDAPWLKQLVFAHPFGAHVYHAAFRVMFGVGLAGATLLTLARVGPLGRTIETLLSHRLWSYIAPLTYAVYLVHVLVLMILLGGLKMFPPTTDSPTLLAIIGLVLVCSVVLAVPLHKFVERPLAKLVVQRV